MSRTRHRLLLLALAAVPGCRAAPAPSPEPAPATVNRPQPGMASVAMRGGWDATVTMTRGDSIVLALPSGQKQVQRLDRTARFALAMKPNAAVSVRLDSLQFTPAVPGATATVGAIWTGRLTGSRVVDLTTTKEGALVADLTNAVAELFPRLPAGGARPGTEWSDNGSSTRQVDIFSAMEDHRTRWSAGAVTVRGGIQVLPIAFREELEQRGQGSQAGRAMNMTSQGVRSGTYYLTMDGRIDGAVLRDSVAMLISIPATREVVPTIRIGRTEIVVGRDR